MVGNPGPLSPVRSYVRIMADATAKKKVPTLMAATLLGARLGGSNPKEQVKLKVRMEKLKESIVREATVREAEMRDKEEKSAIIAAIDCLETTKDQEEAIDRCCDILRERLGHLYRREEQFKAVRGAYDESSSDEEIDEKGEGEGARGRVPGDIGDLGYWRGLLEREEGPGSDGVRPAEEPAAPSDPHDMRRELRNRGFLRVRGSLPSEKASASKAIVCKLRDAGWPPVFCFLYDAPWDLVKASWGQAELLLGGPCVLEPSLAAFLLDHRRSTGGERYVGQNFALPHRDYTYSASTFSDGEPKILSVWVPLNEVTTENGCMYVVPREFDENFDKDGTYEHMSVQTTGGMKDRRFLNFPINGAKPLPGQPGDMMCWFGNTIHWGASCHSAGAADPRASIALVFRRADAVQEFDAKACLTRQEVERRLAEAGSAEERLGFVKDALGYFEHWYDVPKGLREAIGDAGGGSK